MVHVYWKVIVLNDLGGELTLSWSESQKGMTLAFFPSFSKFHCKVQLLLLFSNEQEMTLSDLFSLVYFLFTSF